jgi:hypothetical protein
MDKIRWTDHVGNKKVLPTEIRGKEEYPTHNKKGKIVGMATSGVKTVF